MWSDGGCDHDAVVFSCCCLRDVCSSEHAEVSPELKVTGPSGSRETEITNIHQIILIVLDLFYVLNL